MCHYLEMKLIRQKLSLFLNKVLFLFPSSLPVGMTEFKSWMDSIIQTYAIPDNDSSRFALATMILHLSSTISSKPKVHFARSMRKAMANQVAAAVMQDLKAKQQAAIDAEAKAVNVDQTPAV